MLDLRSVKYERFLGCRGTDSAKVFALSKEVHGCMNETFIAIKKSAVFADPEDSLQRCCSAEGCCRDGDKVMVEAGPELDLVFEKATVLRRHVAEEVAESNIRPYELTILEDETSKACP